MKFVLNLLSCSVLTALAGLGTTSLAQDVNTLLRTADKYRMSADNLEVHTLVRTLQTDGSVEKERSYKVFAQAGRKSLVLMQSPSEKGQKVLMLGDDFWLLMPDSQRPMRITPMQKLVGDASTGDIATLRWSDDYTAQLIGEDRCGDEAPQACWHLSLTAARKGVSYQRIELWLGKTYSEPLAADLYVLSDKLAKHATFVMDRSKNPTMVTEMVLQDRVSNHKTTQVRYAQRKERQVPSEWLNPMFLSRNPSLD